MITLKVQESEKSFNQQSQNTFVLVADNVNFTTTKIEIKKLMKEQSFDVVNVRVVNPYKKVKLSGKKRAKVIKKRAKKFIVRLKEGQKLSEEFKIEIK